MFDSPKDKYGKTMSIPDDLILNYCTYATGSYDGNRILEIEQRLKNGDNPKIIKEELAWEIVKTYNSREEADEAKKEFSKIFARKELPDVMPEFKLEKENLGIMELLVKAGICASNSEVKRLIKQNAISIDAKKIDNIFFEVDKESVIKVGKRRFLKVLK